MRGLVGTPPSPPPPPYPTTPLLFLFYRVRVISHRLPSDLFYSWLISETGQGKPHTARDVHVKYISYRHQIREIYRS